MIYTVTLNPAIDYVIKVPDFSEGILNKVQKEFKYVGGKGINVSRVLNEFGITSKNLGFVGGFTGQFVKESLKEMNLAEDMISVSGETRINIKLKAKVETEINGTGPVVLPQNLATFMDQITSLEREDWLVLSGSIPTGVPKDIYVKLAKIASEKKSKLVIDISDQSMFDLLKYRPVLVKPNQKELGELFKVELNTVSDIIPYAERLVELGALNVLVSMGEDGALLFNQKGVYRAEGVQGVLVNSVGAGDSVVAGFISEVSKGSSVMAAFKKGIASGSATAFSEDLATKKAVTALLEDVHIYAIKEY